MRPFRPFNGRIIFKKIGPLFLPNSLSPKTIPSIKELEYIATYLTYSDLYGNKPSMKDLDELTKGIDQKDMLLFLSLLNTIIINDGFINIKLQKKMVERFFSSEIINKLNLLLKKKPTRKSPVVFSELQLTNLIKFFILQGDANGKEKVTKIEKTTRLSNIFLIMNDLISQFADERIKKAKAETKSGNVTNVILEVMTKFFPYQGEERFDFIWPRYFVLFLEITGLPEIRNHASFFDIPEAFRKATGLSLEEFFALGFGIFAQFSGQSFLKNRVDFNRIKIEKEKYFEKTTVNDEQKEKIYKNLVITIDQFGTSFRTELSKINDYYFNNTILMSNPLIEIDAKTLICSNLRFLTSKITAGVYWTIFDWLKENNKNPLALSNFFGVIFERYVRMVFERVRGSQIQGSVLNTIHFPMKYRGRKGSEEETPDIIIEYPNYLIFVEVVATRLRLRDTIIAGNIEKLWEDLDKMIIQKAKQLHRTIEDFQNGLFSLNGRKYEQLKIKGFYPVIITLEGFPHWSPVKKRIDEALNKNQLLQKKNRIATLEIIDIEELENLESLLSRKDFLTLLEEKLNNEEYKNLPFKNFLYETHSLTRNKFLSKKTEELIIKVERMLFNK